MKLSKFIGSVLLCVLFCVPAVLAQGRLYSGAELYSFRTFKYGKFEARMQLPAGSGLVSSMFLYFNDSWFTDGSQPWVEIDMESLGKEPDKFQSNLITGHGPAEETKIMSPEMHGVIPAVNHGYHTYTFEWTPTYVAWFVDGRLVRKTESGKNDPKDQVRHLNKEQSLRFNLWSHEDEGWVGPWNPSIVPVYQYINWIKVYKYTPGKGEGGTDFTLDWKDDFDSLDGNEWGMGDHTFVKNRVQFNPDNVVVKEGTLILCLTQTGKEGHIGRVPADRPGRREPRHP